MEDDPKPLPVAINGLLRFKWMHGFRPQAGLLPFPLRVEISAAMMEAMTAMRDKADGRMGMALPG